MLWLIAGQGALETLAKLGQSSIHIPVGTIVALVALVGAPAPPFTAPAGASGRILNTIVLAALAAWAVPAAATWALGPTGPWAVGQEALQLDVALECPGTSDPADIAGTVRWTWSETDLLTPLERDFLIVELDAEHGAAQSLYLAEFESPTHPVDMAGGSTPRIVMEYYASREQTYLLGLDLDAYGEIDGHATFTIRSEELLDLNLVDVSATYVHGDRWRLFSDAVSCSA